MTSESVLHEFNQGLSLSNELPCPWHEICTMGCGLGLFSPFMVSEGIYHNCLHSCVALSRQQLRAVSISALGDLLMRK